MSSPRSIQLYHFLFSLHWWHSPFKCKYKYCRFQLKIQIRQVMSMIPPCSSIPRNSCCSISQARPTSHCSSEVRATGRLRMTLNWRRYLVAREESLLQTTTARLSDPCFSCRVTLTSLLEVFSSLSLNPFCWLAKVTPGELNIYSSIF